MNTLYYYSDGKEKFGPCTLDELKERNVNSTTLIWYRGQTEWVKASEVEALRVLFELHLPPLPSEEEETGA